MKKRGKKGCRTESVRKNSAVLEHYIHIKSLDVQVDLWELVTHAEVRADDEEDDSDEGESWRGCDEDRGVHREDEEDG